MKVASTKTFETLDHEATLIAEMIQSTTLDQRNSLYQRVALKLFNNAQGFSARQWQRMADEV